MEERRLKPLGPSSILVTAISHEWIILRFCNFVSISVMVHPHYKSLNDLTQPESPREGRRNPESRLCGIGMVLDVCIDSHNGHNSIWLISGLWKGKVKSFMAFSVEIIHVFSRCFPVFLRVDFRRTDHDDGRTIY
jgi:hypothetical protein